MSDQRTTTPKFVGPPNCVRVRGVLVDEDGGEQKIDLLFPVSSWERVVRGNKRYTKGACLGDGEPPLFAFVEDVDD